MKKARIFTLIALLATLAICLFAGCSDKGDKVTSISLKDHDPDTAIEIAFGEVDFSEYTVVASYESGKTEEIALSEEIFEGEDVFKLYQIGDHDVTINYGGQKYTFKLSVKRASFGKLSFPENNVFTYDGKAHTIEVDGDLPSSAVITYVGGNSFVNAGTYNVTAVVSCDGYVTEKLSTTVRIDKAKYDMSGVSFNGKEVVYDGNVHSLAISGSLPEGVATPTYTIDGKIASSATDVGEYTVKATFANNDPNYEAVPEMEALLKITPAEYTVKGVDLVFKNEDGSAIGDATKIYDGKSVTFDLNDYDKLSKKISVSFTVCDKDGKVISTSNKKTGILNAGVYTVKAEFTHADGKNYQPIDPIVYTFEVFKADAPTFEDLKFSSAQITYDGKAHSIEIIGLPSSAGVTVTYEYYKDGVLVLDADGKPAQAVSAVGYYVVNAVLKHGDANRGEIKPLSATLTIRKMTVDTSAVGFYGEKDVEYSGLAYEPPFTTWKDVNGTSYDILQYGSIKYYVFDSNVGAYVEMSGEKPTDVGLYKATIDVRVHDDYSHIYAFDNSEDVYTVSRLIEIVKKELTLPEVEFASNSELIYAEAGQEIGFTLDGDTTLMTASGSYYKFESGSYVAMEKNKKPTDVGLYKFVVTVALKDSTSYIFSSGRISEAFSFEFSIEPRVINLNGVALSYTGIVFNGNDNRPVIDNLPEHVVVNDIKYYDVNGRTPLDTVVNAGQYRVEVTFTAESANYALMSESYDFTYEIHRAMIDIGELSFNASSFVYNGADQKPQLVDDSGNLFVNENVTITYELLEKKFYFDEYSYIEDGKAINVGTYKCRIWIVAKENYELVGDTFYEGDFTIKGDYVRIADIDAMVDQSNTIIIKLPFDEKYNENYDSATHDELFMPIVCEAIFGEYSEYASCQLGNIKEYETGSLVGSFGNYTIKADTDYVLNLSLDIKDEYRNEYSFLYRETDAFTANNIKVRVIFVSTEA